MFAKTSKGLFITGTDTGVGKTIFAAALAKSLTDRGIKVAVIKPAETGVEDCSQLGPDAKLLKWATQSQQEDNDISPYRLKAPLAPSVAASREQIRIDYSGLVDLAKKTIEENEFTIIEGAGGLMVPLAGGFLMADFALAVDLPVVLVSRPNLGTINHTLLSLFAAQNMDIPVAGYIINNMPTKKGLAEETAAHSLASMTMEELLGVLDHVTGDDKEKITTLAELIPQLPTYPLLKKYLPD